jgi:hypothetical protein
MIHLGFKKLSRYSDGRYRRELEGGTPFCLENVFPSLELPNGTQSDPKGDRKLMIGLNSNVVQTVHRLCELAVDLRLDASHRLAPTLLSPGQQSGHSWLPVQLPSDTAATETIATEDSSLSDWTERGGPSLSSGANRPRGSTSSPGASCRAPSVSVAKPGRRCSGSKRLNRLDKAVPAPPISWGRPFGPSWQGHRANQGEGSARARNCFTAQMGRDWRLRFRESVVRWAERRNYRGTVATGGGRSSRAAAIIG